jgi:hypothetical protein
VRVLDREQYVDFIGMRVKRHIEQPEARLQCLSSDKQAGGISHVRVKRITAQLQLALETDTLVYDSGLREVEEGEETLLLLASLEQPRPPLRRGRRSEGGISAPAQKREQRRAQELVALAIAWQRHTPDYLRRLRAWHAGMRQQQR